MKIALVTADLTPSGGGIKEVVEGLSMAVSNRCVDVRVFGVKTSQWDNGGEKEWRGARATASATKGPNTIAYSPDLLKNLLAWQPDLVHVHGIWQYPSAAVLRWHKLTGLPYVVSPHGLFNPWALKQARFKKAIARLLYVNSFLKNASAFIVSTDTEKAFTLRLNLPNEVFVLPNGIDLFPEITAQKSELVSCEEKSKHLLFLGRIHPTKNVFNLLRAWKLVTESSKFQNDWCLKIAGWGRKHHEKQLLKLISDLKFDDRVQFLGPIYGEKKIEEFKAANAYIIPSINEAFPITILEAWSVGTVVLMTEHCNLPVAFEKGAAFRIRAEVELLANDILDFFEISTEAAKRIGDNGHSLVSELFTWDQIAEQALIYYREVIDYFPVLKERGE